jgi:hypothetical protein
MRTDCFVYISGPMTARETFCVEENCVVGAKMYFALLRRGIPAFCPHLSAFWPSAFTEIPYTDWIEYDFRVIDRCTHLLMLPRWQESKGAVQEHAYALEKGVAITYSLAELIQTLATRHGGAHEAGDPVVCRDVEGHPSR